MSRGELVEIGAGFRLPDLIASTGAPLREVGTTNRTHLHDYADAIGPQTGCVLKVHPSNFRVDGFTSAVPLHELRPLTEDNGVPLWPTSAAGCWRPTRCCPTSRMPPSALAERRRRRYRQRRQAARRPAGRLAAGPHGNHRAVGPPPAGPRGPGRQTRPRRARGDARGGPSPVSGPARRRRAVAAPRGPARRGLGVSVVAHDGRVGGGGARCPLPGWAVRLPERSRLPCAPVIRPCCHGSTTAPA